MGNSAHSGAWQGPTSRANRLQRKLGEALSLDRLEALLKEEEREEEGENGEKNRDA